MKRILMLTTIVLMNISMYGQLNMNDSTAQVIGYWDKNEKQTYTLIQDNFKIKDSDTISRETYQYTVDISIVDSTADSYIIDWFYRDCEIKTDNPIIKKLASVTNDMTVRIRTDELGAFQEVVNWEEVRDYILKGTAFLKEETKDIPNMDAIIKQIEGMYSTKESIELGSIKEIQQYYTFHGAKYELGEEYTADMKAANLYGGEPFDTKVTVWLDELNPGDNNYIIRMVQTVDPEQLTKATFAYLNKMAETLQVTMPENEKAIDVTNETWTSARIHGSGWVIYSIETKEIKAEGITKVEERIIEIQ